MAHCDYVGNQTHKNITQAHVTASLLQSSSVNQTRDDTLLPLATLQRN